MYNKIINKALSDNGLTQHELAKIVGVSEGYISCLKKQKMLSNTTVILMRVLALCHLTNIESYEMLLKASAYKKANKRGKHINRRGY